MLFAQNVIRHFLPHRFPFVMVESVDAFSGGDSPSLEATFAVSADAYIFTIAHESNAWPSPFVIEGLGQSCALLSIVWTLHQQCINNEQDPETVFEFLHAMEDNPDTFNTSAFEESTGAFQLPEIPYNNVLASVNMDVLNDAYIGDTIQYTVTRSHSIHDMSRFAVQARVGKRDLVRGFLVGTTNSI